MDVRCGRCFISVQFSLDMSGHSLHLPEQAVILEERLDFSPVLQPRQETAQRARGDRVVKKVKRQSEPVEELLQEFLGRGGFRAHFSDHLRQGNPCVPSRSRRAYPR